MSNFYFLLLCHVLTLIQLSNGRRYRCPTNESTLSRLSPCYCGQEFAQSAWKVIVVCKGFVNTQTLRQSLLALDDYHIDELIIYGSNLKYLPRNVFNSSVNGTEINTISIIASVVEDVAEDSAGGSFFEGIGDSLRILRVEWSKGIGSWNWSLVSNSLNGITTDNTDALGNRALEEIYLFKNDMNGVLTRNFDSMSTAPTATNTGGLHPTRVILRQNGLRYIDATFESFKQMRVLDVSWNALERTGAMFSIRTFPDSLQTLYLNNNKLTKLLDFEDIWLNTRMIATNLEYIDYRGNKINCNFNAMEKTNIPGIRTATIGTTPYTGNYQLVIDGLCYSPIRLRYQSLMSALSAS